MRIPKLRGFKNRFKIEYEVVNVGAIDAAIERGAFETPDGGPKAKGKGKASKADAQITINQDLLRAAGLVKSLNKPLKILGNGELSAALFVVADAFTASARTKIEAAGGTVSVLEVPSAPLKAIGVEPEPEAAPEASAAPVVADEPAPEAAPEPEAADEPVAEAAAADDTETDEAATTSGDDA